jgi:glyoxylase-like metal-dependent hydrolase (beta-lactamase superfamily II)
VEAPIVLPVVTTVAIPAGTLGPDPVSFEVRCFVVSGPTGLVLIDTGPPGTSELIGGAIASVGADWTEVTDIVLTHRHFDHTGGVVETARLAPTARLWAGADDVPAIPFEGDRNVRPLVDGQLVGTLRVFDTPGHAGARKPAR